MLEVLYDTMRDRTALIDAYDIFQEMEQLYSSCPPVEFGAQFRDIYSDLVETPCQFTRGKLKAHKSRDAVNYYIRYMYNNVSRTDVCFQAFCLI